MTAYTSIFYSEDGGDMFFWNVGNYLQDYMAS
jgi:hypothetical protein